MLLQVFFAVLIGTFSMLLQVLFAVLIGTFSMLLQVFFAVLIGTFSMLLQVFFAVLIGTFSIGNITPHITTIATAKGAAAKIIDIIDNVSYVLLCLNVKIKMLGLLIFIRPYFSGQFSHTPFVLFNAYCNTND